MRLMLVSNVGAFATGWRNSHETGIATCRVRLGVITLNLFEYWSGAGALLNHRTTARHAAQALRPSVAFICEIS
jgi:hypothetical protein